MSPRVLRLLALAPFVSLAACVASTSPTAIDDEGTSAAVDAELASPRGAFTYFVATRSGHGFAATRLDGKGLRCAPGAYAASCALSSIDLSATGLADADAQAIVGALGHDARRSTIVLLGALDAQSPARAPILRAFEIWRAPAARAIDGDVLHVSHGPSQALWIDDWSGVRVSSISFVGAPKLESCGVENGEAVCSRSYDTAQQAAASSTGLLVVGGVRADGVVLASQYFLRVSIGERHAGDGFAYCKATQTACDTGSCFDDPAMCHAQTGTGRGQIQPVRYDTPLLRTWLLATGQTFASDYPTP